MTDLLIRGGTGSVSEAHGLKSFYLSKESLHLDSDGQVDEASLLIGYSTWRCVTSELGDTKSLTAGFEVTFEEPLWVTVESGSLGELDDPEVSNPPIDLEPLDQIAGRLRDWLGLPVQDVANFCGVRRRQFYNILDGRVGNGGRRERHLRLVYGIVRELRETLDGDPKLRAAVLMPLTDDFKSFFDIAAEGDLDEIRRNGTHLIERVRRGDVSGMLPRVAPMFKNNGHGEGAVRAVQDES